MHIGLIGLGNMGLNMRERMWMRGLDVTAFDRNQEVSDVKSIDELLAAVPVPRLIWTMVPDGHSTDAVMHELAVKLDTGDLVIDGGNSRFPDDQKHAVLLAAAGIRFVDCGVVGGSRGVETGYRLMAGGDPSDIERCLPVFDALRPDGERPNAFIHAGLLGAGHYAKMVHSSLEFAAMQAYAEGYELLAAAGCITDLSGTLRSCSPALSIPPGPLNSRAKAPDDGLDLNSIGDSLDGQREARWAVHEAMVHGLSIPTITAAVFARFDSRQGTSPGTK